ncbi:Na(+)-translocating NADH-quinone reductase subunit A [Salmonirosea aquatica]|uniref:Na(+)-translocating NADH-quinone reductase subunit A n=1 Tax=Salmonirosea aquatica TaxID=2654236 RepID=A0A7C9FYS4_9BACT|nr:Na(+)-translocating NADH-quinone reductase subunit A [Cytophagaceae bacterium SJW1-29]
MAKPITLHKGYDIKLVGEAEFTTSDLPVSEVVAIKPPDFPGLVPKLMVGEGDEILAGQPLFFDKNNPQIKFVSSVSGEVAEVVRGSKRRIMEVRLIPDRGERRYVQHEPADPLILSRENIINRLLEGGCWNYIRQRPFSLIANPEDTPKSIFVSCFDTAPLAPDLGYIVDFEKENFQTGLAVLNQLSVGNLHIGVRGKASGKDLTESDFKQVPHEHIHPVQGPHPAGNVGIQIHHLDPIKKGDIVWYVHPQDVIIIGRLFREGRYRADRVVALTGSSVKAPQYFRAVTGQTLASILNTRTKADTARIIQGNVLTGTTSSADDFLSHYTNQITVIPEGDEPEFLGWLTPGIKKLSLSRTFFSWLFPKRNYQLDTNMHGEERAFVMTGQYDQVLPMNIMPVVLLKSILARDIERMEQLGIYEVSEEDFALCEFVCTSKIEVQRIISEGLELVRLEG